LELDPDNYSNEEFDRAVNNNDSATIRAIYLTQTLLEDDVLSGIGSFVADLMEGVIKKAGECDFQLPANWTKLAKREQITNLFFEGHKEGMSSLARDREKGLNTLEAMSTKPIEAEDDFIIKILAEGMASGKQASECASLDRKELDELTQQYPNPVDFAVEYLDFRRMLELKAIQAQNI